MKFTVKITHIPREGNSSVLAFFNLIIENQFVIKGLRYSYNNKTEKYCVSMPSMYSEKHKGFIEICNPLNNTIRTQILDKMSKVYSQQKYITKKVIGDR